MRPFTLALLVLPLLPACSPKPAVEEPVQAVRTLVVQGGSSVLQHDYAAEIRPRTESRLDFRVGGKLVQRMVNLGDAVKPGQALARIDAADLLLGQDAARAAYSTAQAQLALSETEFKRYKELHEQNFISGLELERREAVLKAARAQVEQARAQAGVQANQAGYALLVGRRCRCRHRRRGRPCAVLAAGAPVLRVAHDGPRDAVFSVPEDRAVALRALLGKPGALKLRAWGSPDAPLPASVREVAAAADPVTRTFLVKADVGATALRLGQTASVLMDAQAVAGVIKLPLPAVFEQGGLPRVWLLNRQTMQVQARPVQIAGADGNLVLVGAGLAVGDTVVTAGVHVLTEG